MAILSLLGRVNEKYIFPSEPCNDMRMRWTENQCLQEKLDSVCKEQTAIRKTFAETVAAKPVSQEATVPTGEPTVVTNILTHLINLAL